MSLLATLSGLGLLAQSSYDYSYTAADTAAASGFAALGVGYMVFICCMVVIALVFFVFNVWMIIDVMQRTEAELPNKTMWMVLLIVGLLVGFGGIAALVYYFSVKKKLGPVKK